MTTFPYLKWVEIQDKTKRYKRMHGMVRHFPAFLTIFFGLYGQVVDLKT